MPSADVLKLELISASAEIRTDRVILDSVREALGGLNRRHLKQWIERGAVLLDGKRLDSAHASACLSPGLHRLEIEHWQELSRLTTSVASLALPDFSIQIIYENEDLLVLNKPSGTASVPHDSIETRTAVNYALAHRPSLRGVGRGALEPGILHRLDTGTSGLLVFACTDPAYAWLHDAWKGHRVTKVYRALVQAGGVPPLPYTLRTPLGHDPKSARKMIAVTSGKSIRGRPLPATTHLLKVNGLSSGRADLTVQIETGVMHQIRCHLSSIGCPVLGDPIYGASGGTPKHAPTLEPRLWLHAWRLTIPLPSGENLELEAPLPEGWATG